MFELEESASLRVSEFARVLGDSPTRLLAHSPTPLVRLATHDDVHGIAALVNEYARRGDLLPRSAQAISHGIGNWFVAEGDGVIVGCVSLLRYTSGLVEVRSLAVSDSVQGQGIGKKLMHALIAEAKNRHIPTLFALTRAVPFFLACGFTITDKSHFPEKVWHDCQKCPLVHNCDETAMVLDLQTKN
ncbi:MAG: N-acetyltransferase [Chloroflexi bacterium]|nr:N-acetyltransferase [Chloroflexota bacterium]MBP8054238.1 N-acetyltransferase [Chloroflexota bacterium]